MTAEGVAAFASVGTLVVILATAIAAFVQLRHMGVANGLMVLNDFRQEYEHIQAGAVAALPFVEQALSDPETRRAIGGGAPLPESVRPVLPLMRLFEILGGYCNRNIVPADVVCDLWSPVVMRWWNDLGPLVAVMRRSGGSELFENWESIAVRSQRWLAERRSMYPRGLERFDVVDPWSSEDAASVGP